jgi:hypothetical protein
MRYVLTEFEWAAIRSFIRNKPRGIPRVDDRRVAAGIGLRVVVYVRRSLSGQSCLPKSDAHRGNEPSAPKVGELLPCHTASA